MEYGSPLKFSLIIRLEVKLKKFQNFQFSIFSLPDGVSDPAPVYRSSVTLNINSSLDLQDRHEPQDRQELQDRQLNEERVRQIMSSSPPSDHPRPGPSMPSPTSLSAGAAGAANRPYIHVEPLAMPRMQAFASTSTTASSSTSRNAFSAATRKQVHFN